MSIIDSWRKIVLALLFGGVAQHAVSQNNSQLFEALPQDQVARIEQYNWRQIRSSLFFASRHRVVLANTTLLFGNRSFVFNPFEDTQTTLEPVELERAETHSLWFWQGTPAGAAAVGRDPAREHSDETDHDPEIRSILYRNSKGYADFAVNTYSVDASTGRAVLDGMAPESIADIDDSSSASGQMASRWENDAFRSLTGRVQFFEHQPIVYVIEPLRLSPRYHLVWQIDPQHWLGSWDEENAAYNEYLDSLPEEPRNRPVVSVIK